jgi:hypothetical protein
MIVCPNCRNANEEETQFCSRCGQSLEPGLSTMGPVRRDIQERADAVAALDVAPPKPVSRVPLVVTGVAIALGALIAGLSLTLRPNPCQGTNFSSDRFGYCLTVPEGWEAGPGRVGAVAVDEISRPREAATVLIVAVDLAQDQGLEDYAASVRDRDSAVGLDPGPIRDTFLDGVEAVEWDITSETETGQEFVMRQVVAVRNEVGWIISLSDNADSLPRHEPHFEQMLASWNFR